MLPLKPEYFASSHSSLDSEDDDRPDVWVLSPLGCHLQLFELAIFQLPVPRWLRCGNLYPVDLIGRNHQHQLVHRYLEAVSDEDWVVVEGASPIEEPTIPEGSDGLGCQLACPKAANRVSDEPLAATEFGCRPSLDWGHFTRITL